MPDPEGRLYGVDVGDLATSGLFDLAARACLDRAIPPPIETEMMLREHVSQLWPNLSPSQIKDLTLRALTVRAVAMWEERENGDQA